MKTLKQVKEELAAKIGTIHDGSTWAQAADRFLDLGHSMQDSAVYAEGLFPNPKLVAVTVRANGKATTQIRYLPPPI